MKDEEQDFDLEKENLDDSVVEEEFYQDKLKKLRGELNEAKEKAKEYLDGWQRAQAEFVNVRKRDEESKQEFFKFANLDLISQLLPVLDSFELSLLHPSTSSGQADTGLEVIYKQFLSILKSNGLEEESPLGAPFDPRRHEALGEAVVEKAEDDQKVVEVVQKGYILSGKIIRPAKVIIGKNNG